MKWLHNILKASTLSTALFIFQACYGTPNMDFYEPGRAAMSFYVVSEETGAPLEGISINVNEGSGIRELGKTGADGRCSVEIPYFRNELGPYMSIQDPASAYMTRDTMLADLREREILIELVPAE